MPPQTHDSLSDALAALGTDGLYVHFGEVPEPTVDRSRHRPDEPAGIRAVPAGDLGVDASPAAPWAMALRPSKVARMRTLDSAGYTPLRFHGDFVGLSERHGEHAHAALREAMATANPRSQPFLCLCLTTRHLADRAFIARGEIDPEGSRRVWADLLVAAGYDILVDRDGAVLAGDGPQALVLRPEAVSTVATSPTPDGPVPAPR